jgi:hypothetical protein
MKDLALLILCAFLALTLFSNPSFAEDAPYFHYKDYSKPSSGDSSTPSDNSPAPRSDSLPPPMRVGTNLSLQTLGMTDPLSILGVSLVAPGLIIFIILFLFGGFMRPKWRGYWNEV